MKAMKTSDLLVQVLENEGVKYIYGIPGEENLDFLESLRSSSIELILTRHEQAAGFMAAILALPISSLPPLMRSLVQCQ